MEGECGRVARAGGDSRLIGVVDIEALDRRLGFGLDPEIARRADPDIEGAALRVDRQMAGLSALDDAADNRQRLSNLNYPGRNGESQTRSPRFRPRLTVALASRLDRCSCSDAPRNPTNISRHLPRSKPRGGRTARST